MPTALEKFLIQTELSDNISETPEGYLICHNVPITRIGGLVYSGDEVGSDQQTVIMNRTLETISDPATIASFMGKPITLAHPKEDVSPENWKHYAVGTIQNVRVDKEKGYLLADLFINDQAAIEAIKNKTLREVSCGYDAEIEYISDNVGLHKNIMGNHLALVKAGRAGSQCAIKDGENKMTWKQKFLSAFSKTLDEMPEEEMKKMDEAEYGTRIEALESMMDKMKKDACMVEPKDEANPFEERLAKLEALIADLVSKTTDAAEEKKEETKDEYLTSEEEGMLEVLAPEMDAKAKDAKLEAVKSALKRQDSKMVIEKILGKSELTKDNANFVFRASALALIDKRASVKAIDTRATSSSVNLGTMSAVQYQEFLNQNRGSK